MINVIYLFNSGMVKLCITPSLWATLAHTHCHEAAGWPLKPARNLVAVHTHGQTIITVLAY